MVICKTPQIPPQEDFKFNNVVVLLQPVEVASKSGSLSRTSQFTAVNIKESLDAFGADDFEIAALAAVGAVGKLQATYMSPMSSMNVADKFENFNPAPDVQEN